MSKKIEVFADDSHQSMDVIKMVKEIACSKCEVIIYDNNNTAEHEDKAKTYDVKSYPTVVLDGKIYNIEKLKKMNLSKSNVEH